MIYNMQCFIKLKLHDAVQLKQECIPVGCVPSAAVAVSPGGGGACPDQARPGPGTLPGPGTPWTRHPLPGTTSPGADPPAAGIPPTRHPLWEQTPPVARHAGIPPAMHAGIARPPRGQTHTCKNITFATWLWTVKIRLIKSVLTVSKTFSRSVPFT